MYSSKFKKNISNFIVIVFIISFFLYIPSVNSGGVYADEIDVSDVWAYSGVNYAIGKDSNLWGWGNNEYGQIGDGTKVAKSNPKKIMNDVQSVDTFGPYSDSTCALKKDGSFWVWGANGHDEVNGLTKAYILQPMKIMDDVQSFEATRSLGAYVIKKDGSLWGSQPGESISTTDLVKIMDDVQSITVEGDSSTAYIIKKDGSLWAFGRNDKNQLGDGTTVDRTTPVKIMDDVRSIDLDYYHTYVIKKDGSLWSWGDNEHAQLGDGTKTKKSIPVKILDNVVSVEMRYYSRVVALTDDGSLWAWGSNNWGQIGDGTTTDRLIPVKIMDDVLKTHGTSGNEYAIKRDGSLWAWGYSYDGQVGNGTTTFAIKSPVKIMEEVQSVRETSYCVYAIKKDNSLWAWGRNFYGQVGDGTRLTKTSPVKVMDDVISIDFSAEYNSCTHVMKKDGTLWAWGNNENGQVGNGEATNRFAPVTEPVQIMDNVRSFKKGYDISTYSIKNDGSLWVWGDSAVKYDEVRDDMTKYKLSPTKISFKNNNIGHPEIIPPTDNSKTKPNVGSSKDATLKKIKVSTNKLSPKFKKNKVTYKLKISKKKKSVKIIPKLSDSKATMKIKLGKGKYKSIKSIKVKLKKGKKKTVYIKVTAQNKKTTKTYKIVVSRKK